MLYPSVNKDVHVATLKRELYAEPTSHPNMAKRKRRNRKSNYLRKTKVIFHSLYWFPIDCHFLLPIFSHVLRDSTPCFVYPSVRHTSLLTSIKLFFDLTAPVQILTSIMTTTHPHTTKLAMYPAVFFSYSQRKKPRKKKTTKWKRRSCKRSRK